MNNNKWKVLNSKKKAKYLKIITLRAQFASTFNSVCFLEFFFSKTTDFFFAPPPKFQFPEKRSNSLVDQILNNIYI